MPKVGIDIGHGSNTYPPSKGVKVGGELYAEHTFNASVAIELEKLLKVNGVDVYMAQKPFAQDVNLNNRTDAYEKQKVDMIYSIHANAGASSAKGVGVFYWHKNNKGKKLADLIMEEVRKEKLDVWGPGSRPSKVGDWTNFHMLRVPNKNIPAILGEFGFMTNPEDFKKIFQNKKYIQQIAKISAKAICRYFGITYKAVFTATSPTVKGEDKLELTPSQRKEMAEIFSKAHKDGIFSSDQHSKDVLDGSMSISKAIYLTAIIAGVGINKERI